MQAIGRQMITLSAAMLTPLGLSTKTFADFDDAMRSAGAVSQATADELARMTDVAKELGRTTSFTAIEVANLMAELGRAGFKPDQVNAMTGAVLNLARATGTDATMASGIMAASIRQFSLNASDATRVADGLTAAANKSFNTVESLGDALSYAGPVALDFNVSLEDTLAILGGLGNVGIQGSNAGTALRRLLTVTGAEAEKLKGIFGVSFVDAAGNARPLIDTLSEVNAATAGLGTAARAQKFNEAFGLLGITGASAISKTSVDIKQLAKDIKEASGLALDTAAAMDSGIGGAFRIFMSALEGMQIALGSALQAPLSSATKSVTSFFGVFTKLIENNRDSVVAVAKAAVAIGSVGAAFAGIGLSASFASVVIGGFLSIIGMASAVIGGMIGAVTFLLSPIGLLSIAAIGIGVAFAKSTDVLPAVIRMWQGTVEQLSTMFSPVIAAVTNSIDGIRNAIMSGNLALAGQIAVTALRLAIVEGFHAIGESVGGVWGNMISTLGAQLSSGDFQGMWNTAVTAMGAVWDAWAAGVVQTFTGVARSITEAWRKATTAISGFILEQQGRLRTLLNAMDLVNPVAIAQKLSTGQSSADRILGPELDQAAAEATQWQLDDSNRRNLTDTRAQLAKEIEIGIGGTEQLAALQRQLEMIDAQIAAIGSESPDILGDAKDIAAANIARTSDAIDAALDEIDATAEARKKSSSEDLANSVDPATSGANAELDRLRADLKKLQDDAKSKRAAADAEPVTVKGVEQAAGIDPAATAKASTPVAVTSSAAGLIALGQGQGGGVQQQTLAEIRAMRKAAEESRKSAAQWIIQSEKMIRKIENLGLGAT